MSISSNRIKYLDKENKILVKDFKTLISNAILTDLLSPLLESGALEAIATAYSELNNLANTFTSIYNQITDPNLVSGIVNKVLTSLNLNDPRLASVAVLIAAIKSDVSGVKEKFLIATMDKTAQRVFDNPSLLNNYSGITSDTSTLITIAALNQMSEDLIKNNFNYATLAGTPGSGLNPTTPLVGSEQNVTTTLLGLKTANPGGSNPPLSLDAGVATMLATDSEFATIRSVITAFHIYKVETYKVYLDVLVGTSELTGELQSSTFDPTVRGVSIANYHLKVKVYQDYGMRHLVTLLRTTATNIATSQIQTDIAYSNFMSLVAKIKTEGLIGHASYTALDDVFISNFKAGLDPMAVYRINLNHTGALSTAVTLMRRMHDANYSTTSIVVIEKDMIPLYVLTRLAENLPEVNADADRINHLRLLAAVVASYYDDVDTRTAYDNSNHTDYFNGLSSVIKYSLDCGALDKTPTALQAGNYGNPNVGTVWSYVRLKYKALAGTSELDTILTPIAGDAYVMSPQLSQAYSFFELTTDYDKTMTDSMLGLLLPVANRRDAIKRVIVNPDCTSISVTG